MKRSTLVGLLVLSSAAMALSACRTSAPAGQGPPAAAANYDEPPVLIGGLSGLLARLELPQNETARDGRAMVRVVIGTDGVPQAAWAEGASSAAFGEAARQAVLASRFTPARSAGQPVEAEVTIPFRFDTSSSPTPPRY